MIASQNIKIPVVLLLMLTLGRLPIPWIHTHEHLNEQVLAPHVNALHSSRAGCELPNGWHIHWFNLMEEDNGVDGWTSTAIPCPSCDHGRLYVFSDEETLQAFVLRCQDDRLSIDFASRAESHTQIATRGLFVHSAMRHRGEPNLFQQLSVMRL